MPEAGGTARETADAVLEALTLGDWTRVAGLVDPDAAAAFRVEQLDQHRNTEAFAATDLQDSGLPTAVAEWFQQLPRRTAITERLYGVQSGAELEQLALQTMLERYLRAKHGQRHPDGVRPVILGEVVESPNVSHVVFRRPTWRPEQQAESSVDVLTLRRSAAGWRCELNGGLVYNSEGGSGVSFHGSVPGEPGASAA